MFELYVFGIRRNICRGVDEEGTWYVQRERERESEKDIYGGLENYA